MQSTSSLFSLPSCSPILLVRHYIQDCHVQKVTVHADVLLSNTTALSSPRPPDVVLGERVLRMLISCPECHRIPLTRSVFMFGIIEDTPSIIRTGCSKELCVYFLHIYTDLQKNTRHPLLKFSKRLFSKIFIGKYLTFVRIFRSQHFTYSWFFGWCNKTYDFILAGISFMSSLLSSQL